MVCFRFRLQTVAHMYQHPLQPAGGTLCPSYTGGNYISMCAAGLLRGLQAGCVPRSLAAAYGALSVPVALHTAGCVTAALSHFCQQLTHLHSLVTHRPPTPTPCPQLFAHCSSDTITLTPISSHLSLTCTHNTGCQRQPPVHSLQAGMEQLRTRQGANNFCISHPDRRPCVY